MGIIFVLLTISILLALFFLTSFLWASKTGQYEDIEGPAFRLLFEDEDISEANNSTKNQNQCK